MTPTAITQCLEQITRIVFGIILAIKLQSYGIQAVAVGLAISMLLGELVGLFFLSLLYFRKKQSIIKLARNNVCAHINSSTVIFDLFSFGIPTTFTRLISSISLMLEASLLPLTLQKIGFTINQAAAMYGQFSGVSMTILSVPTILTFSLAISLVPAISEAEAQGKLSSLQFRTTESLRLTFLLGLPAVVALLFMPAELSTLLFNIPEAGSTLRILGFGGIFLYLCQTSNGILQGLGLVNKIFVNTTIGSLIKILGIIYLASIPELNINGAAIGFTVSYIVVCFLNLEVIRKSTGIEIKQKQIVLPIIAALIMATSLIISTLVLSPLFSKNMVTLISLVFSGLIYLILVILWEQLHLNILFTKKTKV
jgi:stage V sporulation protein B